MTQENINKEAIKIMKKFINDYIDLSWNFGYGCDVDKTNKLRVDLREMNRKIDEVLDEKL